jgi:hypothetical protein
MQQKQQPQADGVRHHHHAVGVTALNGQSAVEVAGAPGEGGEQAEEDG